MHSILVVEDDWILRANLVDNLSAENWTVTEAESAETALEIIRSGTAFDLLITDIRLGGMLNGWDVADVFRAADTQAPVIYLSGNPVREGRKVENSMFLSKPYPMDRLVAICHHYLLRDMD